MIKQPKEVKNILKKLTDNKFSAYTVGGCVRDSLAGLSPFDWDIATSARFDDLVRLFPEAKVVSEKYSVVRLEYIDELYDEDGEFAGEEGIIVDIATYRKDGVYSDGRRPDNVEFVDTIEEDLPRRDFTINAMADGPFNFVDPYDGKGDVKKKLIRAIGDASERLKEDPIRMLRAIRMAAELDFDLHKDVFDGIRENYRLLEKISIDRFREEFVRIMAASHAGKGLSMIMDTGIINLILGDEVMAKLTRREKSDLTILCQNIDRSKQVEERRLGLFYSCLDKKKAIPSIDKFNFDKVTHQHLIDAVSDMAKLYFTSQKTELKKFIYDRGWERYNYLANLEKAQRIVFDYSSETKIKSKMYLIDEIKRLREPVMIEDLAIDGNDLIEAGICQGEEVGKMLGMLIESLHVKPNLNTRKDLLKLAEKYKKNKFAAMTRGIKWLR